VAVHRAARTARDRQGAGGSCLPAAEILDGPDRVLAAAVGCRGRRAGEPHRKHSTRCSTLPSPEPVSRPSPIFSYALAAGTLVAVLDEEVELMGVMTILWPASRFRAPKVRAFVDCIAKHVGTEMNRA
jgi:hypothetical protein